MKALQEELKAMMGDPDARLIPAENNLLSDLLIADDILIQMTGSGLRRKLLLREKLLFAGQEKFLSWSEERREVFEPLTKAEKQYLISVFARLANVVSQRYKVVEFDGKFW